jgi:hypothetical protein
MYIMIDDFIGDPDELYNLVVEEINKREIPGIHFSWGEEVESTKMFFNKGDKAKSLYISFRDHIMFVLGYQVGRSFVALSDITHTPPEKLKAGLLHHLILNCYMESIRRSIRTALSRHLKTRNRPVPEKLDPTEIFFQPDRQSAA